MKYPKIPLILSAVAALTACSSSNSSGGGGGEALSGNALISRSLSGLSIAQMTGAYNEDSGALSFSGGGLSFNDPDGPEYPDGLEAALENGGVYEDGDKIVGSIDRDLLDTSRYEYVSGLVYVNSALTVSGVILLGTPTSESNIPSAARATYQGAFLGQVFKGSKAEAEFNGNSTVNADFARSTLDVVNTVTSITPAVDATVSTDIGFVNITGMTIAGNRFSGGTMVLRDAGGQALNVTGAGSVTTAEGTFFGYDAARQIPDELGGAALLKGNEASAYVGFIAD